MDLGSLTMFVWHDGQKSTFHCRGGMVGFEEPLTLHQCVRLVAYLQDEIAHWPIPVPKPST